MTIWTGIKNYIFGIPRNLTSIKHTKGRKGKGKQITKKSEDQRIEELEAEIKSLFPSLQLSWWLNEVFERELTTDDNEEIYKFWFEKEVISLIHLQDQFIA